MPQQRRLPTSPSASVAQALPAIPAILVDLDGCFLQGERLAPGAGQLMEAAGQRLFIVSNNSTQTAEEMSRFLAARGATIPPARILLAGETALQRLSRQSPGMQVMILGSAQIVRRARELELEPTTQDCQAVLLTRDLDLTYPRLLRAIQAVAAGTPLVVSNPDLTHPDAEGRPVPETGSLLAPFQAVNPTLSFSIIGKPEPPLFEEALSRAGAGPHQAVMIGDNALTDGAGAQRLGIPFLLVGRGKGSLGATLTDLMNAPWPF